MSLSFDSAVRSLAGTASVADDERLNARLSDVQALLAKDLVAIEHTLRDAAGSGTQPAADAATHLVAMGGKRVRPTAVLLAAACFGPVPAAAREIAVVVELVHSATLLHDDVIDDGDERRGAKTARMIWGNAVSVLAGDTLLVESLKRTSTHAPALMSQLLQTLESLVGGEVVQLRGRRQLDLTESTYERVLFDKTASLFRFATWAGASLGAAPLAEQEALARFGERVGMAFQLVDDVIDYTSSHSGKTLCADLLEGKITLPLVLAVKKQPELIEQVRRVRGGEFDGIEALRAAVVDSGACALVRERARGETEQALAALRQVPRCAARDLLEEVAERMVGRSG